MRYVQRNAQGEIIGDFANRQPGRAEEAMEDNAQELITRYAAIAQVTADVHTPTDRQALNDAILAQQSGA